MHHPYSTRRPNPFLAGIWEQYRHAKFDAQDVKNPFYWPSLDIRKRFPRILGQGYETIAAPAMDVNFNALIQTIGTIRRAKELIIELEGRRTGVRTATDWASFSSCSKHPTVSKAVQSMAPHVRWNVEPTQYPTTRLPSLLASTSIPWFNSLSTEFDLSEGSIRKALQDGRLRTLGEEFTRQTLPPPSQSGECCECEAFIAFTNAIRRHMQKPSLVSRIHTLQTKMEADGMDEALLDAENYDALDILRRNPSVLLKMCPACGATRELMDRSILDLAPWVGKWRM